MILSKIMGPAIGGIAAIMAMPQIEKMMPVVAYMAADSGSIAADTFTAHVTGRKIRECVAIAGTHAGWYRQDGVWYEAHGLSFVDDPSFNSRPAQSSMQDFGVWRWSGIPVDADRVKATIVHDCDGRLKLTTIGPFDVVEGDE